MNRPIRIGLIAEGQTELGSSVPYVKPEEGGKLIPRKNEGALHTLIRRELKDAGLPDCNFVQRHPSTKEIRKEKHAYIEWVLGKTILTNDCAKFITSFIE
jgi:hypothetical protein